MSQENVELVREAYDGLQPRGNHRNPSNTSIPRSRAQLLSESPNAGVFIGHEGVVEWQRLADEACEGMHFEPERIDDLPDGRILAMRSFPVSGAGQRHRRRGRLLHDLIFVPTRHGYRRSGCTPAKRQPSTPLARRSEAMSKRTTPTSRRVVLAPNPRRATEVGDVGEPGPCALDLRRLGARGLRSLDRRTSTSNGRPSESGTVERAWDSQSRAARRGFLGAWGDYRVRPDEYRELTANGCSSLSTAYARGRVSGLESEGGDTAGANLCTFATARWTRSSHTGTATTRPRRPGPRGVGDVAGERGARVGAIGVLEGDARPAGFETTPSWLRSSRRRIGVHPDFESS